MHALNRLAVIALLLGAGVAGCTTRSDSPAREIDTGTAAGSARPPRDTGRSPAVAATDTARGDSSDVTGSYSAVGTLPAPFSDIELLGLATIDDQGNPAPLNGFIRPKRRSDKDFQLVAPTLKGRDLSFSTEAVGGVSYRFTGTFSTLGNFPVHPPEWDDPVLAGTLTKMSDGKVIAETPVTFTYSAGG